MKKIFFLVVVPALAATLAAQAQAIPRTKKVASQFPSMTSARLAAPIDESGNSQSAEQGNSLNRANQPAAANTEALDEQKRKLPASPAKP